MLLEEFPDVSISKIRFLESQGLVDPERTPSGYRKFYDADVDRLRVILREQRQNFLPLRVIRDRLESGQIDDSGPMTPPRGLRNVTVLEAGRASFDETGELVVDAGTVVPTAHHPAAQMRIATQQASRAPIRPSADEATSNGRVAPVAPPADKSPESAGSRGDSLLANELCARAGITDAQLADLVSYGLIRGVGTGANVMYSAGEVAIATAAAGLLVRGVDARHLRDWRRSAEREAALFEQLILPSIRHRNPQSRQQAAASLREMSALGAELRTAILTAALHHHLEP